MNIIKRAFLFTAILSCFIECKKDGSHQKHVEQLPISLLFPDTVYTGTPYRGRIAYRNAFDTITRDLRKSPNYRDMVYAYCIVKSLNEPEKLLKEKITDTVWATTTANIPLENIVFKSPGTYFFDGFIIDEVTIENFSKDSHGNILSRVISNDFRLSKKVVVLKQN